MKKIAIVAIVCCTLTSCTGGLEWLAVMYGNLVLGTGAWNLNGSTQHLYIPEDSEDYAEAPPLDKDIVTISYDKDRVTCTVNITPDSIATLQTDYKGIRDVLKKYQKEHGDELMIYIKPDPKATYKNTLDILDEMSINGIKKYTLVDSGGAGSGKKSAYSTYKKR